MGCHGVSWGSQASRAGSWEPPSRSQGNKRGRAAAEPQGPARAGLAPSVPLGDGRAASGWARGVPGVSPGCPRSPRVALGGLQCPCGASHDSGSSSSWLPTAWPWSPAAPGPVSPGPGWPQGPGTLGCCPGAQPRWRGRAASPRPRAVSPGATARGNAPGSSPAGPGPAPSPRSVTSSRSLAPIACWAPPAVMTSRPR